MVTTKMSDNEIKNEVRKRYASLVTSESKSSCCGPECCSPSDTRKGNLVKAAGYSDEELESVPSVAVENSFGCGNPLAFAGVEEGQTVLDIGSGAGIDCFIAADKVGKTGKVIGIDMTPEMIDKARANAIDGGFSQVEFRLGEAEAMPVNDATVDWVISNCVINLSPVKPKVFSEIYRVLKPGGHFSISDIVLGDDLPKWLANNLHAWTGCVAGAIKERDYLQGLRNAGLTDIEVESRIVYDDSVIRGFLEEYKLFQYLPFKNRFLKSASNKIWSAKIRGRKPLSH
jgi:SAM-dependent methyltransferase